MFTLDRFGTVSLPDKSMASDMGSLGTIATGVTVAGGIVHDAYGTDDAPPALTNLQMVATYKENSAATLETVYRALMAKRGKYDKLYRQWDSSGLSEWVNARLRQVSAQYRHMTDTSIITNISAVFEVRSPNWNGERHGDGWTLDSGEYFDIGLVFDEVTGDTYPLTTGSEDITVTNGGNVAVGDAIIEVEADTTTAITQIEVQKSINASWVSLFTLAASTTAAGDYFEFDFGKKTVKLKPADTDQYDNFTIGVSNPYERWFLLDPGDNDLRIIKTGGAVTDTIRFTFYDGWA